MESSTSSGRISLSPCLLRLIACAALGLLSVGCDPGAEAPEALSAEEIPGVVKEAFQEGEADTQQAVQDVLEAVEANDDPRAYVLLQGLLERRDLTPEQREAATRAMMTVSARLNAAAASGDATAEKMVKTHQAYK